MNPFKFALRRPVTSVVLIVAVTGCGILGLYKMRVEVPGVDTPRLYAFLEKVTARVEQSKGSVPEGHESDKADKGEEHERHKILVTSPKAKDVTLPQPYVCQIHSQRHIKVRALEGGYLKEINIKEGQAVKKGDLMFKIVPTLYQAKLDAENAEVRLAQVELNNSRKLADTKVVSQQDRLMHEAKLLHAQAKANLAKAELDFTNVAAPFDGIVDHQEEQLGSLIKEGDILTTLSDNSVMWVYFNVPEAQYLEYMASLKDGQDDRQVELILADGSKFNQIGKIGAIEANFDNTTGNIPFRADFPNPDRLLRHGQTGTVVLPRVLKDVLVIPQRAIFEILDRQYVYVLDQDDVVHQREVGIQDELDDIYVVNRGLAASDRIVLEGMRDLHDGAKVVYEFKLPEMVMANLKNKAE